jgi:hypothetical protein
MGVNYNHKTDQSNLLLYYDFYNPRSWNGTGTVYDLSGNSNNGTVIGSPTLVNRTIDFSGMTGYINYSEVYSNLPWTSVVTFKQLESSANTSFRQTFFGHTSTSVGGWNRLYVDINATPQSRVRWLTRYQNSASTWTDFSAYIGPSGSSYVDSSIQDAYWKDNFFSIITTISEDKLFQIYLNGVLKYSTQRSVDTNNEFRSNKFGAYSTSTLPIDSQVINCSVYNKYFTQEDVDHTMSLYRARYGI